LHAPRSIVDKPKLSLCVLMNGILQKRLTPLVKTGTDRVTRLRNLTEQIGEEKFLFGSGETAEYLAETAQNRSASAQRPFGIQTLKAGYHQECCWRNLERFIHLKKSDGRSSVGMA